MMGFLTMCSFMGLVRNPLGAGKWLLSCVCPLMLLQITILLKCFITLGTCKWLLSCMLPFMHLQTSSVNKTLVAHGTGKWLLSSVGSFMHLYFATLVKSISTFGTGKWFFSCVSPFRMLRVTLAKPSVLLFKGDHHTTFYIVWFLLLSLDVSRILEHMLLWLFSYFMGLHVVF